jgi:hypothetical protein
LLVLLLAACSPQPALPTIRPTYPFPAGTPVPVTSADGVVIEQETGPLLAILSTADDHGLAGPPALDLLAAPEPGADEVGLPVPTGTFAPVLEIRRLPPDFLRTFVRVQVGDRTGWVPDWQARRTAYVIAFDSRGCACPFAVTLWGDAALAQATGTVANLSPLRVLALDEPAVQVQSLGDGALGWLPAALVHESAEPEFIRRLPRP